jgi:hypothetical protein
MSESRKMTISRALDAVGGYYADRAGGGDVEAGWKLLQRAMDEAPSCCAVGHVGP